MTDTSTSTAPKYYAEGGPANYGASYSDEGFVFLSAVVAFFTLAGAIFFESWWLLAGTAVGVVGFILTLRDFRRSRREELARFASTKTALDKYRAEVKSWLLETYGIDAGEEQVRRLLEGGRIATESELPQTITLVESISGRLALVNEHGSPVRPTATT